MDFSTDIKFSNNLIKNKTTYITYSGNLFKQNSDSVYIVYGFGENWTHTTEQKMNKNKNGFGAEIKILEDFNVFNFCFRNLNNEWDNNNGSNYIAPIEENQQIYENFIINENIINNILNNLFEHDISDFNTKSVSNFGTVEENNPIINPIEENEIIINKDILSKSLSNEIEIDQDLVNEAETSEIENTSLNTIVENVFSDIYNNESINENQDEINNCITENDNNSNMDSLIDEILSPIVSSDSFEEENLESFKKIEENDFNMNSLVDEILSPIVSSDDSFEEENNSALSQLEFTGIEEKELEKDAQIDNAINSYITDLYNNIESNVTKKFSEAYRSIQEEEKIEESFNEIEKLNNDLVQEANEIPLIDAFNTFDNINDTIDVNYDIETETNNSKTSNETGLIVSPRSLNKFYIIKKRIKIAFCKLFSSIPKFLSKPLNESKQ